MSPPSPLIEALQQAVGAAHVLTEGDLSTYEHDWRRRARGRALAVVRPASAEQVAAVVRACVAHGATIVPQGGNTGLAVGSVPDETGTQVLLSLRRMDKVRAAAEKAGETGAMQMWAGQAARLAEAAPAAEVTARLWAEAQALLP